MEAVERVRKIKAELSKANTAADLARAEGISAADKAARTKGTPRWDPSVPDSAAFRHVRGRRQSR